MQQIISANRLRDGLVVYLGPGGEWVTDIAEALVFTSDEACAAGRVKAQHAVAANVVLDPLVVDLAEESDARTATTLRNRIRAFGPTVDFKPSSPAAAARS